jgi:hypothetical protein
MNCVESKWSLDICCPEAPAERNSVGAFYIGSKLAPTRVAFGLLASRHSFRRSRLKYFLKGNYSDKYAAVYLTIFSLKMESTMESRFASLIATCDGNGRDV